MHTPGAEGHSASAWQARQVFVAVLQTGFVFAIVQSALVTHSTHPPVDAPVVTQAARAGLRAAHSVPVAQPRQVFVAALQTGFAFVVQSALVTHSTQAPTEAPVVTQAGRAELSAAHSLPLVQPRQAFVLGLHTGRVAPLQSPLARHSTQTPASAAQTGAPASRGAHSLPDWQPRHIFDVESQTGVPPPHEAAVQGGGTSEGTSVGPSVRSTLPSEPSLVSVPPSDGPHRFLVVSQTLLRQSVSTLQ
jgi:hypothetical protein